MSFWVHKYRGEKPAGIANRMCNTRIAGTRCAVKPKARKYSTRSRTAIAAAAEDGDDDTAPALVDPPSDTDDDDECGEEEEDQLPEEDQVVNLGELPLMRPEGPLLARLEHELSCCDSMRCVCVFVYT